MTLNTKQSRRGRQMGIAERRCPMRHLYRYDFHIHRWLLHSASSPKKMDEEECLAAEKKNCDGRSIPREIFPTRLGRYSCIWWSWDWEDVEWLDQFQCPSLWCTERSEWPGIYSGLRYPFRLLKRKRATKIKNENNNYLVTNMTHQNRRERHTSVECLHQSHFCNISNLIH